VLIKYKANINQTTKFGWTPLHIAAKKNEIPGAILLIQSGCNLNLQD
jgi:ankyrin repeat protein